MPMKNTVKKKSNTKTNIETEVSVDNGSTAIMETLITIVETLKKQGELLETLRKRVAPTTEEILGKK